MFMTKCVSVLLSGRVSIHHEAALRSTTNAHLLMIHHHASICMMTKRSFGREYMRMSFSLAPIVSLAMDIDCLSSSPYST